MPSVARDDTLFTTQLLICYKVLEKTDHLSMDHQVDHADTAAHHELDSTGPPPLPVRKSESPAAIHHKLDMIQLALGTTAPSGPDIYITHHLCTSAPLPQVSYGLYPAWGEKNWALLPGKWLSMNEQAKNRLWLHCSPTQGCPWKTAEGKIFPMGRALNSALFVERKRTQG